VEDARPLAAALKARGHEALSAPMLTITPAPGLKGPLNLAGVQALLFTSANGLRAFAGLSPERGLPAFTVGDASAAAARAAGFVRVEGAGGDVADLIRLVAARLDPGGGALYHAAGRKLAGDLKGALEARGFTLRRAVLYHAEPARRLSGALSAALAEGRLDAATFFSPRTAGTFVRLIGEAGLGRACARLAAVALSEAVAEQLRGLDWGEVQVAERPDQEALLERLDAMAGAAVEGPNHGCG
ncbi:MAG: uroporphyrinogen-III synthase, partial [Kiloniellaceae bacterium]